jgi:hypothetical protein
VYLLIGGAVIGILSRFDRDIRRNFHDTDNIALDFLSLIWPALLLIFIAAGTARLFYRNHDVKSLGEE